MNIVFDVAACLAAVGGVLSAIWSQRTSRQMVPNGGSSMKDQLDLMRDQIRALGHQVGELHDQITTVHNRLNLIVDKTWKP